MQKYICHLPSCKFPPLLIDVPDNSDKYPVTYEVLTV